MADIEINDVTTEEEPEEVAEHEASKAAGAAEVHQENAQAAADEAKIAAEAAASIANSAINDVMETREAADSARNSAEVAQMGAAAVVEAVNAQTAVLQSLLDRLEQSSQPAKTPTEGGEPVKKQSDKPPAQKKRSGFAARYYGGR